MNYIQNQFYQTRILTHTSSSLNSFVLSSFCSLLHCSKLKAPDLGPLYLGQRPNTIIPKDHYYINKWSHLYGRRWTQLTTTSPLPYLFNGIGIGIKQQNSRTLHSYGGAVRSKTSFVWNGNATSESVRTSHVYCCVKGLGLSPRERYSIPTRSSQHVQRGT